MKENLHDIDKLFKAAIEDHAETPSVEVWEAIDKKLDKNSVIDIKRKYIQLKRVAVALLVLLLGFGAYTLITRANDKELSKYRSTKNNEQTKDAVTLTPAENKQDSIVASNAIIADENNGSNVQAIRIDTLIQSNSQREKIITPDSVTTNKNDNGAGLDKISGSDEVNRKEPGQQIKNTRDKSIKNSSAQTTGEILLTSSSGSKIIINKRKQKTTITNADLGNTGDEIVNAGSDKDELTHGLAILPEIYPEMLKAEPDDAFKKAIVPQNNISPIFFNSYTLPAKANTVNKATSFTATIFYAPSISSNQLKDNEHEHRPGRPDNDEGKEKIGHDENHQFSSTLGVLIDYNMNKHWAVQSGLALSQKSIHISPKTIYAGFDDNGAVKYRYNCSSGYLFLSSKSVTNPAVGDSLQAFESTNTLQYLSIPLALKYNYSFNKIDLFASMGAGINILTKSKMETELANGTGKEISTNNKINGLKSSYFGGNIGVGISYNITGNMAVSFMPSFSFAVTSSTKDANVNTYPGTISMGLGIRYRL